MELSNQLRADLNYAAKSEQSNISMIASKVQEETSKKYEYKMNKIEKKLNDLGGSFSSSFSSSLSSSLYTNN